MQKIVISRIMLVAGGVSILYTGDDEQVEKGL